MNRPHANSAGECDIVALNYLTNYNYIGGSQTDHLVMLQVALRTLGGVTGAQTVGSRP